MRAIRFTATGDADVLMLEDVDAPRPGDGEVRVNIDAAGVNFIDTYHRRGQYPVDLPSGLGLEGAGTIDAVGDGVPDLEPGQRVAWMGGFGSYAEQVVVNARVVVPVPESVDTRTAAAVLLQGVTAHYLATSTFPLHDGHVALVHAAGGGVGQLLCQIAARRGARVIGTASTAEKERLAKEAGAGDVIRYTDVDLVAAVRDLTAGEGVHVVYDGVGKATFDAGLDCLRPRGMMVLFGASSGPVPPFDVQVLNRKGSLYVTRPSTGPYTRTREELLERANDLFAWIADGTLRVTIDRTWPLADAADAHRYLEGRQSKGKLLLVP